MIRAALLSLGLCLAAVPAAAEQKPPCPAPGKVIYPLGDLLQTEGLALEFDFSDTTYPDYGSPEHIAQQRDTVLAALKGKSDIERDVLLLGRLTWSTQGTIPLLGIAVFGDAGLFDTYLEVLDRRGLEDHAKALRHVQMAFPVWNTTARNRYDQWSDGKGGIRNPLLDLALRNHSAAFLEAEPSLLGAAEDILAADPSYPAYLDRREAVSDFDKHTYLMAEIGACLERYTTPQEADAALSALPPLLGDLHVLDLFLLEAGNGGMHQYIYNATGMLAQQLQDVLTRWGLTEQAGAVAETLSHFPQPYPRDTQARRAIMAGFDIATDEAVNAATWIADEGSIQSMIKQKARVAGYWPG